MGVGVVNVWSQISTALEQCTITEYGFASFADVLPLLECRAKARIPQRAKSVIVCLFPYHVAEPRRRNISRYAMVEDYHIVAGNMLKAACERLKSAFPENEFVFFTDNSPIREVSSAVRAGLGVLGKNGLLIHPKYGSFVFIGEIVTDLTVPGAKANGMCIGCGRCAAACPAGAISPEGIDRERCLSHITQKKGTLTPEEETLVRKGNSLWGCDICQEVCPYNHGIPETEIAAFQENIIPYVDYHEIGELVKTRAFGFRGSGVIRRNYEILYGKQG